jgi:Ni/Co efflux regulator RcnB
MKKVILSIALLSFLTVGFAQAQTAGTSDAKTKSACCKKGGDHKSCKKDGKDSAKCAKDAKHHDGAKK